jgi:putative transposase
LSEERVSEALEQARLRDAIGRLSEQERGRLAESLVAEMAEGRELPGGFDEQLLDALLGALIAGRRGEREILGQDGVLGELSRRLVERALQEELSEHLGYPAGQAPPGGAGNSRICRMRHMRDNVAPKTMLR